MQRLREVQSCWRWQPAARCCAAVPATGAEPIVPGQPQQDAVARTGAAACRRSAGGGGNARRKLMVTVGKSLIIDSPREDPARFGRQRRSGRGGRGQSQRSPDQRQGAGRDLADRMAAERHAADLRPDGPDEPNASWMPCGSRLPRDFPNDEINVTFENDTAFVRGTVKDVIGGGPGDGRSRRRLGKTVNLLRVDVPPVEPQILLKVRFANVDRSASASTWA